MDLTVIINKVISLFLIMIIGVYGKKRKIIFLFLSKEVIIHVHTIYKHWR